jgi:uncharacterized protein YrrD
MLLLGSRLISTPIMGLQTGTKLAQTAQPIIDPADLKIVAYIVEGPLLTDHPSIIRMADVREFSDIGMIIDSNDEFIGVEDVVSINKLFDIGFTPLGMAVVDENKHKLGKVDDYSLDASSFIIQQINVKRGIVKSLTDTGLVIHRSQIVEINDNYIMVKSTAQRVEPVMDNTRRAFVNPFRSASPQTDNRKV